jgi:hypothetical protein
MPRRERSISMNPLVPPRETTPETVSASGYAARMTEVDDRIDALKEDVRFVGDSVLEAATRIGIVEAIVKSHDARFDELERMMTVNFEQVGRRIDAMNVDFRGQLDQFGGRLDQFDSRLDQFGGRLDQFDSRLDQFGGRLDQFGGRLDQFGRRLDQFGDQLAEILSRLPPRP